MAGYFVLFGTSTVADFLHTASGRARENLSRRGYVGQAHTEVEPKDFRKHVIDFVRRFPYKINHVFPEIFGLYLRTSTPKGYMYVLARFMGLTFVLL